MAMTDEEFESLVHRMEGEARLKPAAHRLRVIALAALPYFYVFGALLLALGLIAALVSSVVLGGKAHGALLKLVAKGSWALSLLVYAILRALWVRSEAPEGHALTREDHPKLFDEIASLRRQVGAPRVHAVFADDGFNAGVLQHSRLGLLGWHENFLFLGLPLMRALSPEQFRAVLAHEFGHLAGAHGRIGGWIYRSRKRWGALLGTLEKEEHWASFVFRPFFRWYSPYFNAVSFARARSNEYDADRAASAATSPRTVGDALVALRLRRIQLDTEYWPSIQERMDEVPEPDVEPHASMRLDALAPEAARRWLASELEEATGVADTHPSLSDRLAALGVEAQLPSPLETSAAEAWLGDRLPQVAAHLDGEWRAWIQERWHRHYESLRERRERLAELDAKSAAPLSQREQWEHAGLVEELRSAEEALPMYRALLELLPESANVHFAIGRLLVARGDAAGIPFIERAIERSDSAIVRGSEWVVPLLRATGREEEAQRWVERYQAQRRKLDEDEKDRGSVWFDEHYEPHAVEAGLLRRMVAFLASQEEVERAWLLKRRTLHYPERPMHVLIVRRKTRLIDRLSDTRKKQADYAVQDAVAQGPGPDGDYRILVTNRLERRQRRRMEGFPGTEMPLRPSGGAR
jgi:Zn-dependent protease with chaperone function